MKYLHQRIAFISNNGYKTGILTQINNRMATITKIDGYYTEKIHINQIIGRISDDRTYESRVSTTTKGL
jgi:hypothetical protein